MLPTDAKGARKPASSATGSVGFLCCSLVFRWRRRAVLALLALGVASFLWMQYSMLSQHVEPLPVDTAQPKGQLRRPRRPAAPAEEEMMETPPLATTSESLTQDERRLAVKAAMQFAWKSYETNAFGADEVGPRNGTRKDNVWGDIACSMVDALDTLWIMDMKDEFARARDYIAKNLSFSHLGGTGNKISVFETIIREVGGLLSAFDLSQDEVFKLKAKELMDLLLPAFEPSEGVFYTYFNPQTKDKGFASWTQYNAVIADIGSLQLETRYLSDITGDKKYAEMGEAFYDILKREGAHNGTGLFPVHFDPSTGEFVKHSLFSIGAYGDSFYEYLLKVFIYSGKRSKDAFLRQFYDDAIQGIDELMVKFAKPVKLYYVAQLRLPHLDPVDDMDHLLCFLPGLIALGTLHEHEDTEKNERHLALAKKLMNTCYQMYHKQPTGLSPDVVHFPLMAVSDPKYRLRPETVESLFYMYRITKDTKYREYGWEIFQSLEKNAKLAHGYGAIRDVRKDPSEVEVEDKMESFFLAETLKYHYLLQAPDDLIPLDEYVFNTEAHPLRIRKR